MGKSHATVDITARTIDLGSSVLNVAHVTRAGMVVRHPLRLVGVISFVLAGAVLAADLIYLGNKITLPPKGSLLLWSASGLAALGTFMLAYATRRFVISLSDGGKVVLPTMDTQFAEAVTGCIRECMAPEQAATPPNYRIDLTARTITPRAAPVTARPASEAMPTQGWNGNPATLHPAAMAMEQAGSHHSADGIRQLNGAQQSPPAQGTSNLERDLVRRLEALQPAGPPANGAPYANGAGVPMRNGPRATPGQFPARGPQIEELGQLIQYVMRANLQHKEALLDLLRVVEDHQKGGATTREDAEAHWQSFSEYVFQYLAGYDDLPVLTDRVGRSLGVAGHAAHP
jgi:hypothetical protein